MRNKDSLRDLLGQKKDRLDLTPEERKQFDALKRQSGKYRGMGNDQLMKEIEKLMRDQSVRDKVKNGELDRFAGAIGPILSPEQKDKLERIVRSLQGD